MLSEKSPAGQSNQKLRVPEGVDGIQVNFCKNPKCANFHVPVRQGPRGKGRGKKGGPDPHYLVVGVGAGIPAYKCKSCGEVFAAKSNIGVASELARISAYTALSEPHCKDPACDNHERGIYSHPDAYRKFGTTDSGSTRYQCKADGCCKTFSVREKPVRRQKETHHNITLFKLLMNKVPLKRILEITGITKPTLYRRIEFFHEQCMRFIGERERRLMTGEVRHDRLYLSTDRQLYHSNWRTKRLRKHVQFMGVGTADNTTGWQAPTIIDIWQR